MDDHSCEAVLCEGLAGGLLPYALLLLPPQFSMIILWVSLRKPTGRTLLQDTPCLTAKAYMQHDADFSQPRRTFDRLSWNRDIAGCNVLDSWDVIL